jgi:hypothetical protein
VKNSSTSQILTLIDFIKMDEHSKEFDTLLYQYLFSASCSQPFNRYADHYPGLLGTRNSNLRKSATTRKNYIRHSFLKYPGDPSVEVLTK